MSSLHLYFALITPVFFFFNDTATTEIYTLSLHDALPISMLSCYRRWLRCAPRQCRHASHSFARPKVESRSWSKLNWSRSEEHTSELQSPCNLVCRLLLEKKKKSNMSVFT